MIALFIDMPETIKRQILVREQLGFAYNRRAGKNKDLGDRAEASEFSRTWRNSRAQVRRRWA